MCGTWSSVYLNTGIHLVGTDEAAILGGTLRIKDPSISYPTGFFFFIAPPIFFHWQITLS
jgi:hypothetical protein